MLETIRLKKDLIYNIKLLLEHLNIIEKEKMRTQMIKNQFGLYVAINKAKEKALVLHKVNF